MRKLIRLEIKKFKLFSYLKSVGIANAAMMGMLCLIYFAEKSEGGIAFPNYEVTFELLGSIVRPVFIIFAAVLISRLIIEEYKSKSITLLFMYPIHRKKLIIAKLMIVACFTFLAIMLSTFFIGTVFYLADSIWHFVPEALTLGQVTGIFFDLILSAIASAGMALIPLYFGMKKKSVPTTIVSAIILVSLTNSTADDVDIYRFIAIPIALALTGCLIAYFSFRNIEKIDVN
ncbi:ABC transporter permease [Neobacillus muris]|uniref:ABC transporter permease n=1 Tax=Neobacillus muris TaxID=2941334 RepID=UPI00203D58C0|nr:ABC transporter permease [Neobacillus muris]